MQRTTIMLPRDLKQRAARAAKSRGISLGELIREALAGVLRADPGASDPDPLIGDTAVYSLSEVPVGPLRRLWAALRS